MNKSDRNLAPKNVDARKIKPIIDKIRLMGHFGIEPEVLGQILEELNQNDYEIAHLLESCALLNHPNYSKRFVFTKILISHFGRNFLLKL